MSHKTVLHLSKFQLWCYMDRASGHARQAQGRLISRKLNEFNTLSLNSILHFIATERLILPSKCPGSLREENQTKLFLCWYYVRFVSMKMILLWGIGQKVCFNGGLICFDSIWQLEANKIKSTVNNNKQTCLDMSPPEHWGLKSTFWAGFSFIVCYIISLLNR